MPIDVEDLRFDTELACPAGDPQELRAAGARMRRVAARALETAALSGECGSELALWWQGAVAQAACVELNQLNGRSLRLLPGIDVGGVALNRYADVLERTIGRVGLLRRRAAEVRAQHRHAVAAACSGLDPAQRAALVELADRDLDEQLRSVSRAYGAALDELSAAGTACARLLAGLTAEAGAGRGAIGAREAVFAGLYIAQDEVRQASVAPVGRVPLREPESWHETALHGAGDAAAWTWNHTAVPVVNGAVNLGEAMLEHPEDVVESALGAAGMLVGAAGEVGGTVLDASVVGAPAGVALNVASAGLIVAGGGAVADGASRLANHANQNNNTWLSEASGPTPTPIPARGRPGDPLPDSARPDIAGANWKGRVCDNGRGECWQSPDRMNAPTGSPKDAEVVRIMDPEDRYPYGYVRFHNEHGQVLTMEGKPGPKNDASTHFPIRPDGTFDIPKGWAP